MLVEAVDRSSLILLSLFIIIFSSLFTLLLILIPSWLFIIVFITLDMIVDVDTVFDCIMFVTLSRIPICVLLSFEISSSIDFFNFDLNTCNRLFLFLLKFVDDIDGDNDSNDGGIEGKEVEVNDDDDDDERKTFKYGYCFFISNELIWTNIITNIQNSNI